ncbi:MAG: glutamine--fructose-6-phosphate transaminase (isomerizing) [candidate division WOR-3 bacterium]|uniref:Glutamine--fructose-6-phosphate aminotransferase [isomerizing] n=1 Tax=candidate division WOR-3 bacterium TaxID=2052148 RepID=A0A7V3ZTC7_UNCW3
MCGIIGYIGNKNVDSVLLVGLEKLEYRGYDSVGIAILTENGIFVKKQKGRIWELAKSLNGTPLKAKIGIGHTRWATHGKPSDVNAHPHLDCKKNFAVVHNGVIENFERIKKELIKKGHKFLSETDTEVIPHLLEENYDGNILKTILKVVKKLKGSFAIAIISTFHPDKIIGIRKGSPLIVGLGEEENILASDIPAILSHTRRVITLNEEEIVIMEMDNVKIYDFSGKEKKKRIKYIEWEEDMIEKGGYAHFMLKEIHEQPKVIEENLKRVIKNGEIEIQGNEFLKFFENKKHIIFQAAGTSYHATLYGKYIFEKYLKIFTESELSSELRYRESLLFKDSLMIGVSQSGETADTLEGIRLAKSKRIPILSLVNVKGSTIDRESNYTIYINAGPEIGVASTKAYTAQLLYLLLICLITSYKRGLIKKNTIKEILKEIEKLPDKIRYILGKEEEIAEIAKKYYGYNNAIFLGRGLNYITALEGALKLKEISYIHATGYAAGEMKHGPIALIDSNWPVIAIVPRNYLYHKMFSNIMEVKARDAKIIAITNSPANEIKRIADSFIIIPKTITILEPILNIIPLQLFAYHVALLRGCDVDKPRNLAKSVTVE